MPFGIGNLKNLIILSKFVVGSRKGSRLEELNSLPHLQGELFISELQKVEEVRDVVDANLLQKQGLTNLSLHWDEHLENLQNHELEAQVLESLQPHINLENLNISNYGGAIFSSWLGGPSYTKTVSLCLRGCPNAILLPPLGQLPSLKELSLEGLHAVRMIGSEFYGSKRPFSSLRTLKLKEMLTWKTWFPYVGGPKEEVAFPCLQQLVVRSCPSLIGTLPCQLDCLIKLEIHSCRHLNNSISEVCLPSLRELYLEDCNEGVLKFLVNPTSLTILGIQNLAELVCFDQGYMRCLVKLKELHIGRCDKLTYLWQDGNEILNLTCLQKLAIESCPLFTSFVAGDGEIELPCSFERMELSNCTSLEKLPSKWHTFKHLIIRKCPKITGLTIPLDDPSSNNPLSQLEYLRIIDCDSLTSFPLAKGSLDALKTLCIGECEGVESMKEITVESLEEMTIDSCVNLGSLPQCLHTLFHLTRLEISGCPALEIEEDFPPLPITLSSFYLMNCPKIKCLPNQWHHLTFLHALWIINCPNIECFPKGGFPPNLRELDISGCENVKQAVREWGLPLLTSLQTLMIDFGRSMGGGEGDNVCFPSSKEEEDAWSLLFPSSLTELEITNMRKVERLSSGLHNHLSSLTRLAIYDCPKLRYLPEDGLPPSLPPMSGDRWMLKESGRRMLKTHWPLLAPHPRHPQHLH
ncbi:putative disease resistance protein At3g14460 [Rhodamnia argentea]|uniref:Disease resistance protein At3g14460 n=1 Tax=Rhodamnia argentea TaxID=178133 RepID=A0ABM3HJV0_9MYRT|nr:putative disease resistance protein At3g14460 [Rhodamnia argentea]